MEPGKSTPEVTRYRMNPVELAIFSMVTVVFCSSVYSLIQGQDSAEASALAPMAANPISEARQPAGRSAPMFGQVELNCAGGDPQDTLAQKVRLTGALCGLDETSENKTIVKSQITNSSTRYTATVFTDLSRGKFSTDYIPLSAGANKLEVEFVYPGGKAFTQTFSVNRL